MASPANPTHDFELPPMPRSVSDMLRWDHTRLRRRLLHGRWAPDLEMRIRQHFGLVRREMMGPKSMAKNTFRKVCQELAVNYREAPTVRHSEIGDVPLMFGEGGVIWRTGLWPLMRRVQIGIIGLREMLVRVDWSPELLRPAVRTVTPDMVVGSSYASTPDVPFELRELRWRMLPSGKGVWAWDWFSIENPDKPFYRVVEAKIDGSVGEDYTRLVLGEDYSGDMYPYRWTTGPRKGRPFIPYVLFHALRGDGLWDPWEGVEVVDGSLDVATAWTFVLHAMFRASWPQRWALGAYVSGAAPRQTSAGPRTEVPVDPTSVVHFDADPSVPNPQLGQWGPSSDPELLARTTALLDRAVGDMDGLDVSHMVHDTANPWSAAALSITGEGKREAQSRYTPELMPSDLECLEKIAAIENLWGEGPVLPESGYRLQYRSLPLSAEEASHRREHNATMIAQGRMSIVEAYQNEHPGVTRDEAIAALQQINEDNETFGVVAGTSPTPLLAGAAAADGGKDAAAAADIVARVAAGTLPRAAGIALLTTFFRLDPSDAETIMGTVGTAGSTPPRPAPAPGANDNQPPGDPGEGA